MGKNKTIQAKNVEDPCEYWRNWELELLLLPQQNSICLCLFTYFSSIAFTFTKPSNLSKFTLLQISPYQTCINRLSSWCVHPHPLLTRHDLTNAKLGSSAQRPNCLATLLLCQYKQFNKGCSWACQKSWDVHADAGFLCQYSMRRDMKKGTICITVVKLEGGLVIGRNHKK